MSTEEVVFLHLQEALASLTSEILGSGQRVAVTGITSCVNKPQKLGDGATVFSALPFDEVVQIETAATFDLTQTYLAVDSNEVSVTNTGTSSISVTGSSTPVAGKETRTYRRIAGAWYTTDIVAQEVGSDIADVVLNQHVIPSFIGEAYTNLVQDPTDWTTVNWDTTTLLTAERIDQYINGNQLTRLGTDGADINDRAFQNITFTGTTSCTQSIIIRNETALITLILFNDGTANIGRLEITWATQTFSLIEGESYKAKWLDTNTVEVYITSDAVTAGAGFLAVHPERTATTASSVLVTEGQIIMSTTTMFPFVDGSHAVDVIDKTFSRPDKFIIDLGILPRFQYDTVSFHRFVEWYVSATEVVRLYYRADVVPDAIKIEIRASAITATMAIDFDDGTSEININQKLRLGILLDLTTTTNGKSEFIVIEEDGTVHSVSVWDVAPPIISWQSSLLSIAHDDVSASQADSDFIYPLRMYIWDGIKPTITSNNDWDSYLAGKTPLFSATSAPDVDAQTIDENTSLENAVDKNAKSLQLMKSFDNWHEVGGTNEPAFAHSWVNFGTSDSTAGFYKDAMGFVHLKGKISTGTLGNDAFTLPNGYLPHDRLAKSFSVISNASIGLVIVAADGEVQPTAPSNNTYVSLEGITFYAGF